MPYSWRVKCISQAYVVEYWRMYNDGVMYNNRLKHIHKHKIINECTITFYAFHYYVVVIFITTTTYAAYELLKSPACLFMSHLVNRIRIVLYNSVCNSSVRSILNICSRYLAILFNRRRIFNVSLK